MDLSLLENLIWLQQQQMISPEIHQDWREELTKIDELDSFRQFSVLGSDFEPGYDTIDGCISRTSSFQMEPMLKNTEDYKVIALKNKRKQEIREERKEKKIKVEEENIEICSDMKKQDYIHVRARRGEATDRHSIAERARREKISKKMKYLQDLVPGCNKVTGKATMLDEIINYVQSLQQQVDFLSMKLSFLNPQLFDFHFHQLSSNQIEAYLTMADLQYFPLHQQESQDFSVMESNQTTSLENLQKDQKSSSWETQSQSHYNTSSKLGLQY